MESEYSKIEKENIAKAFAAFGIKAYDEEGNFRGCVLLDELAKAWADGMEEE